MTTPNDPRPDFSDVTSGSSSAEVSKDQVEEQAQTYTVEKGDTLWKIAKQFYGDGSRYPEIFKANTDQLKNPDLIHPGQVLKIPKT